MGRGNTPSGSVAPSWLPSPPSNRCGSPSKSTTNAAHPLSTGNASKPNCHTANLYLLLHIKLKKNDPAFLLLILHSIIKIYLLAIIKEKKSWDKKKKKKKKKKS